jgi:RNA polymerase sigma factor (TIGR02999 family)
MEPPQAPEVTVLLKAWGGGDAAAMEQLAPIVYAELRRLSRKYMRNEGADNTLQATALANEAYLRLVDANIANWNDRVHFFAVASQMMRRILVDRARARRSDKRGGRAQKFNFEEVPELSASSRDSEIVAVDEALTALAAFDERKAKVVELRFFGGLSVEETAAILKISPQSVMRDWKLAKVWLSRELTREA